MAIDIDENAQRVWHCHHRVKTVVVSNRSPRAVMVMTVMVIQSQVWGTGAWNPWWIHLPRERDIVLRAWHWGGVVVVTAGYPVVSMS